VQRVQPREVAEGVYTTWGELRCSACHLVVAEGPAIDTTEAAPAPETTAATPTRQNRRTR
jgi:hypothetical protein